MAKFELSVDAAQLADVKAMVSGIANGYEVVMKNAINRTLSTVQTQAVARIANELNLTSARIKQDFSILNATLARTGGGVYSKGDPIGLVSYGAKQTGSIKSGTTADLKVKVKKAGSYKTIKHAFFASTKHKNAGEVMNVYWREYHGTRFPWNPRKAYNRMPDKYRYKLGRLSGPRIQDIYAGNTVFDPVTVQAQTIFVSNVDQEVKELFRKLAATGKT
ncbi:MAG: hypothetical protein V1844_09910 [Pseudomonadota bacterium]